MSNTSSETQISVETQIPVETQISDEKKWTEQEITSMFYNWDNSSGQYEFRDCVLISDYAYECVGAVLFYDKKHPLSNVAFFDKDGFGQQIGVYTALADSAEFQYLGNGTVSFQGQEENGEVYIHKLTYSSDGNGNVSWKVESNLAQ